MRNLFLVLSLILFVAAPVMAQETPKAELFGGYQFQSLNAGGVFLTSTSGTGASAGGSGCHGFAANVAYNLNEYFGGVGEIGACKETGMVAGVSAHDVNYLFGPRLSARSSYRHVTPFAQLLIGGQHVGVHPSATQNSFALTLGAGGDYKFTERIAFRGQLEYLYTRFGNGTQNSVRIETGVVYRWGSRR